MAEDDRWLHRLLDAGAFLATAAAKWAGALYRRSAPAADAAPAAPKPNGVPETQPAAQQDAKTETAPAKPRYWTALAESAPPAPPLAARTSASRPVQ